MSDIAPKTPKAVSFGVQKDDDDLDIEDVEYHLCCSFLLLSSLPKHSALSSSLLLPPLPPFSFLASSLTTSDFGFLTSFSLSFRKVFPLSIFSNLRSPLRSQPSNAQPSFLSLKQKRRRRGRKKKRKEKEEVSPLVRPPPRNCRGESPISPKTRIVKKPAKYLRLIS